jgi:hypothetical protein
VSHVVCVTHSDHKLTCGEFEALRARSGYRCEICGIPEVEYADVFDIDHDRRIFPIHAVRGLVCSRCNCHMRYVDEGSKHSELAERYEQNAWYRERTYLLSPRIEVAERRADAFFVAQSLGFELLASRPSDFTLSSERQLWSDAFLSLCTAEQLARTELLRFFFYLRSQGFDAAAPSASMRHVYVKWRGRDEGIRLLSLSMYCDFCKVRQGPCLAGRKKVPTEMAHRPRLKVASLTYDGVLSSRH